MALIDKSEFVGLDGVAGLASRLAAQRGLVWGGEGCIRVSPHVHGDREDLERFFHALDRVGARPLGLAHG